MIAGTVTAEGVPTIPIPVRGQNWLAVIDTGFNGDLELPDCFRPLVNPRFHQRSQAQLAGGQSIFEDIYLVDFPFDGQVVTAEASFVSGAEILVGTQFLREYRLEINFRARTVLLERLP